MTEENCCIPTTTKVANVFDKSYDVRRKPERDLNPIGYVVNSRQHLLLRRFFILWRMLDPILATVEGLNLDGLLTRGNAFTDVDAVPLDKFYCPSEDVFFLDWFTRFLTKCPNLSSLVLTHAFTRFVFPPSPPLSHLKIRADSLRRLSCTIFQACDLAAVKELYNLTSLSLEFCSFEFEFENQFNFSAFSNLKELRLLFDRSPLKSSMVEKMFSTMTNDDDRTLEEAVLLSLDPSGLMRKEFLEKTFSKVGLVKLEMTFLEQGTYVFLHTFAKVLTWCCAALKELRLHGIAWDSSKDHSLLNAWNERLTLLHLNTKFNRYSTIAETEKYPLENFFSETSTIESLAVDSLDWIPLDYQDNPVTSLKELILFSPTKPACLPDYPNLEAIRLASCHSSHSFQRLRNFSKLKHLQLHFCDKRFWTWSSSVYVKNPTPSLNSTLFHFFHRPAQSRHNHENPENNLEELKSLILNDCVPHSQPISKCAQGHYFAPVPGIPQWKRKKEEEEEGRGRKKRDQRLQDSSYPLSGSGSGGSGAYLNHALPLHLDARVFISLTEACRNLSLLEIDCKSPQCDPYDDDDPPIYASKFGIAPDLVPLVKVFKQLRHLRLRLNLESIHLPSAKSDIAACEQKLEPVKPNFPYFVCFELVAFCRWTQLSEREKSKYGLSSVCREMKINCYGKLMKNWKMEKTYRCNAEASFEALGI